MSTQLIIPEPRTPIAIRQATLADLPFIDALQKQQTRQVGFMPRQALVGKIEQGQVYVAEERQEEERHEGTKAQRHEDDGDAGVAFQTIPLMDTPGAESDTVRTSCLSAFVPPCLSRNPSVPSSLTSRLPIGYSISTDRYFKRDDVGIIYQMNVVPGKRRGLVGAMLLRAMFERAAYGCRLFCCWCAQDIEANRFWEAMGFVPLAVRQGSRQAIRAGSASKGRAHIFWQTRIRSGDTTTPWWFPCRTDSGSMREDRLVVPIPIGVHWSEATAVEFAEEGSTPVLPSSEEKLKRLPGSVKRSEPKARPRQDKAVSAGGLRFAPIAPPEPAKAPKPKRMKVKADPKQIAIARELRDRWLEELNRRELEPEGKYDVTRAIESESAKKTIATTPKRRALAA